MMLAYQYDIFHSRSFRRRYPLFCVNGCWRIRTSGFRPVSPFLIVKGIYTKMDKHPILAIDLLLLVSIGFIGCCGYNNFRLSEYLSYQ
ncbi:hypothetical protein D3C80_1242060 [compost metagenome]